VTTLAGQPMLFGTADGTGGQARFNGPSGVAVNAAGDTFVADQQNYTIRKVTAAGVVTTFTARNVVDPVALTIDAAGNLYAISDDYTIRKITPAGVVTVLAGTPYVAGSADGTGPAAQFQQSLALAAGADGTVYVADYGNHTIRKITPAGVVTTLAGLAGVHGNVDAVGSAARFWSPMGIAVDALGTVYVADGGNNNRIRKIAPDGTVTAFAGGGTGWEDGTGGGAAFYYPGALALDAAGNLYVCDRWNLVIRKITPEAVVTTPVGVPQVPGTNLGAYPGGLTYPNGIAVTPAGDLVIATANGIVQATLPD